jgi:hypothetical protein
VARIPPSVGRPLSAGSAAAAIVAVPAVNVVAKKGADSSAESTDEKRSFRVHENFSFVRGIRWRRGIGTVRHMLNSVE